MASITCGNCKGTHTSSAAVKACYGIATAPSQPAKPVGNVAKVTATASTATDKQQAFIVKLWGERYPDTSAEAMEAVRFAAAKLTKAEASEQIGQLLAMPKPQGGKVALTSKAQETGYYAEAKKGDVHVVDGTYYRIHVGQHSGKPYAAKATIYSEAIWDEQGTLVKPGRVKWDMAKGMIHKLDHSTLTTAEQAAAFGKLVGRCCFCSHAIDTPESTAVGYGPVCASNYGLPWGEAITEVAINA